MVEPISTAALVIAIISGVGVLIKSIADAMAKSSCVRTTTISSSGSTIRHTNWNGGEQK